MLFLSACSIPTKVLPSFIRVSILTVPGMRVDDESPDGTAGVVRTLQLKYPHLYLLLVRSRQKEGAWQRLHRNIPEAYCH